MALSVGNQMNYSILTTMFGRKGKSFGFSTSQMSGLFSFKTGFDSFQSTSASQIIKLTVQKMQAAINGKAAGGRQLIPLQQRPTPLSLATQETETAPPTQWQVDQAVEKAGGREVLDPWLVDGKTKLDINGRKVIANVDGATGPDSDAAGAEDVDPRAGAEKSIARFGFDASRLDGDTSRLREDLKTAAARLRQSNPNLALSIEYALEDAYTKINSWEMAKNGTEASASEADKQAETNAGQAESIIAQLSLGEGDAWGIRSMGEDLAVFGMDMTAMAKDPYDLADEIRSKSRDMLKELDQRYAGTEAEYIRERNRITGASSRLINGLEGSAVMSRSSASLEGSFASSKVSVSIGGTRIDANTIISVGTVIVDPLVLDLNGDGIDLKSAEEGVLFDMNGNGEQTQMGFIRGDDALLFVDTHGDGVVHDGNQLFGNTQGYANGFEMLAAHDDNGDGVIDENDAIYDQLRLWVEKKEDGVCEKDETMSLREAGITSINLGYQNVREDDGKGNLIGQTGSFTRDDGSEGYAADVWLQEKKV